MSSRAPLATAEELAVIDRVLGRMVERFVEQWPEASVVATIGMHYSRDYPDSINHPYFDLSHIVGKKCVSAYAEPDPDATFAKLCRLVPTPHDQARALRDQAAQLEAQAAQLEAVA